jgi:hypothetical protein
MTGPQKKTLRRLALAFGICAAGSSLAGAPAAGAAVHDDVHVEIVRNSNVALGAHSEAAVFCPSGERAIGGGVLTRSSHYSMSIQADNPLEQDGLTVDTNDGDVPRWWYSAITNNYGPDESFDHYSICSATSDATVEAQAFTGAPGRSGATAHCPAGTRAISGGIGTTGSISSGFRAVENQPLAAGATLAGTTSGEVIPDWYAAAAGGSGVPMKAFAICSAASNATVETASFDANALAAGSAACPGSEVATGGGFGATTDTAGGVWLSSAPATAGGDQLAVGDAPHGWFGLVDAISGPPSTYRVYALCEGEPPATQPPATPAVAPAHKRCKHKKKKHARVAKKKCHRKKRR